MADKKEVKLTLISRSEGDLVRQNMKGTAYLMGDQTVYKYEESNPELGRTSVTVKVEEGSLRIVRHGEVRMEQTFRPGLRTPGTYDSVHGRMELDVETSKLQVQLNEGLGRVEWAYEMYVSGELSGYFELSLEAESN